MPHYSHMVAVVIVYVLGLRMLGHTVHCRRDECHLKEERAARSRSEAKEECLQICENDEAYTPI